MAGDRFAGEIEPAAATVEKLGQLGVTHIEQTSPHAVIIPGAVDAWAQLNEDHGRVPLAELLQPAIDYARNGYPLSQRVYTDFRLGMDLLTSDENLSAIFLPDGVIPQLGSLHHNPGLADAMEMIAREGRDSFYKGELAREINLGDERSRRKSFLELGIPLDETVKGK